MTWHFQEKKIKLTLRSDLFAAAPNLVPSPKLDLNIFDDRLKNFAKQFFIPYLLSFRVYRSFHLRKEKLYTYKCSTNSCLVRQQN